MIWMRSRAAAVISVIMVLAIGLSTIAAPQVNDVPKDHWAYEAVIKLVDKGYLGVYNDGTFKGDEPVSRYLLAFVVYKMLSDIEKGTVGATGEDMAILREVANELRGEIVPLVNELDVRMKALENQGAEDVKALTAERQERKAEASEILESLGKQADQLKAVDTAAANALSGVAKLEATLAAEKSSKDKLIMTLLDEQAAEKTEVASQFAKLQDDKKASDAAFAALEKDIVALKALVGTEQEKTLQELSTAVSAEAEARKDLEGKLVAADSTQAKALEDAIAALKVQMQSRGMEDDKQLAQAVQALTDLVTEEKEVRSESDEAIEAKLEASEAAIAALAEKDNALDAKDAQLDAKDAALGKQIDQLAAKVDENSFNATALVLKVASEQADRNDEYDASIASLRKSMDAANLNITTLKADLSAITGRLTTLETSVSLIKSSLESAVTQIVTVKNDLATLTLKYNTLEAKVAAMQVDIDNKLKTAEQGANDLLLAQSWEAQEREKALEAKVTALEAKIDEQKADLTAQIKKVQGFGIIGLVIGAVGAIVGIVALFLPSAP